MIRQKIIKPGRFGAIVAADTRRDEFDWKNDVIINNNIDVDFLFFGDSITQFWELQAYFGKKKQIVINRGIGGDTTTYALKRYEADVIQLKPKFTILLIGVNDTWDIEAELYDNSKTNIYNEVLNRIVMNMTSMIELSHKNNQKIIICSILPTNLIYNAKNNERNRLIVEVNNKLKNICEMKNVIYIDYHLKLVANDGFTLKDNIADEGLHPCVIGYNIMADELRKVLLSNGIEM